MHRQALRRRRRQFAIMRHGRIRGNLVHQPGARELAGRGAPSCIRRRCAAPLHGFGAAPPCLARAQVALPPPPLALFAGLVDRGAPRSRLPVALRRFWLLGCRPRRRHRAVAARARGRHGRRGVRAHVADFALFRKMRGAVARMLVAELGQVAAGCRGVQLQPGPRGVGPASCAARPQRPVVELSAVAPSQGLRGKPLGCRPVAARARDIAGARRDQIDGGPDHECWAPGLDRFARAGHFADLELRLPGAKHQGASGGFQHRGLQWPLHRQGA
mmetsp:Transcript_115712/g.332374  ORF Transcript_115712/g.332374 Transcript_115712/m.332374 type:complete len:273 (-) Transcript_115712:331-1149(-)